MSGWVASAGKPIRGTLRLPGDKSISHRALMLAALADGASPIRGCLESGDTNATEQMLVRLGVEITRPAPGDRVVSGRGLRGLRPPDRALDCGNSGTSMRLMCGILVGQGFASRLVGDASLSKRPMARVVEPLQRMGARIEAGRDGCPPIRIHSNKVIYSIDFTNNISSAQVKSAILFAGLYAEGETVVRESQPSRDHSERLLRLFGWPIRFGAGEARLAGGSLLQARPVVVPGDFSSAAYFIVAATLVPGSDVVLKDVGVNPRRTGLLKVLERMGADIDVEYAAGTGPVARDDGLEPIATLRVRHSPLRGVDVAADGIVDLIDELPILSIAAAAASGVTRIQGAGELRFKESDRITACVEGLRALGIVAEADGGDFMIEGGRLTSGRIAGHGDHRIAMSFAVAAQIARGPVQIDGCAEVATSFPGFVDTARSVGFQLAPV